MIRTAGRVIHHTSKLVHRLLIAATGFVFIVSLVLAAAAWRLSQGPIELAWLSNRVRAVLSDETSPVRVSFDGLQLAWEGFHRGADYPLDLRVTDITIADSTGKRLVAAPQAHLTFSAAGLLLGRFVPRSIEVDHARIAVTRDQQGAISFGGDLTDSGGRPGEPTDFRALRDQLARPASSDHGRSWGVFDQIKRAHLRDTEVTVSDQKTGLVLRTVGMNLDLVRPASGPITGVLNAPLSLGDEHADLSAHIAFVPGGDSRLDMALSPFRLAGIKHPSPALAVTAPVSLEATVDLDAGFAMRRGHATAHWGAGVFPVGSGQFPLLEGIVEVSVAPDVLTIQKAHFNVARSPDDPPETVDVHGTVTHAADRINAALAIGVEQIDVADLARLWPAGVAPGARGWVMENVTAGLARRGAADLVVEADDSLTSVALAKASGDLDISGGTFTWIDEVPAVEQTEARLHLVDPDTLDIVVESGHQRIRGGADLLVRNGRMRITGLTYKDQFADIGVQLEGPVASAWTLLKEPRLHLLSTHPIGLKTGAGDVAATLAFQFPLENKLQIDDVAIHADAHVRRARLVNIVYGRDFNDAAFDLDISKDGLGLKGRGLLAAIPVTVSGTMDFNSGPGEQVVQKIVATAQPDAGQLDAAGLPVIGIVGGQVGLNVVLTERRNGAGSLAIDSDLAAATLTIDPLAWSKPSGAAATASVSVTLSHDRLSKIERLAVRGDDVLLTGSAEFADGQIRTLLLDKVRFGRTQARGAVHFAADTPIGVVLRGEQIDLGPKLSQKSGDSPSPDGATTPGWTLDGRFDRGLLANGERVSNLLVKAAGDGDTVRSVDAIGTLAASPGTGSGFSVKIEPRDGKRRLLVTTKDAGRFLRGMDAIRDMQSGQMTIDASFQRPIGYYPLVGSMDITGATVKNSPVLGKLLQAITLYGLVDALRGPGMLFTHMLVPFQYDGASLFLDNARAFNSSLGLTAQGSIALSSGRAAISGTIVPVYFFNAMLGRLPLVGKLFSPEEGGGVFAARFGVSGEIDDPSITLNPVSALTPGFLREIFGVFDRAEAGPRAPEAR
jgi:hypothetical protein